MGSFTQAQLHTMADDAASVHSHNVNQAAVADWLVLAFIFLCFVLDEMTFHMWQICSIKKTTESRMQSEALLSIELVIQGQLSI